MKWTILHTKSHDVEQRYNKLKLKKTKKEKNLKLKKGKQMNERANERACGKIKETVDQKRSKYKLRKRVQRKTNKFE